MASCARRLGLKPYEHGTKSASKIGSSGDYYRTAMTGTTGINTPAPPGVPRQHHRRMVSPLVVLITMMFMAILDISAVNVAIPHHSERVRGDR